MNHREIRGDIETMKRLLDKYWSKNISSNPLPPVTKKNENFWEYRYNNVIFKNIDLGQGVYPHEQLYNARIKLSIFVKGKLKYIPYEDPFNNLDFNISIFADYNTLTNTPKSIQASWHLDKNISNEDNNNFFHPEYHFHFGGRAMTKATGKHFGDLLLMSSPRLAHLPLDVILAIDFIIKNFYEKNKHSKLTSLTEYNNLVQKAQERFWKPYILGLASHWVKPEQTCISPKILLPNLN